MLSPHRDDAAFSCAIAIRYFSSKTAVTVANLFTVSEHAPFRRLQTGSVSTLRLIEDQAFSKLAKVDLRDLRLVDAPQRLSIELSQISTTRSFDAQDELIRRQITDHIAAIAPDLVVAPLALGDHIDHRIAQNAAIQAGVARMCFYEDLPYAARLPESASELRARSLGLELSPWRVPGGSAVEWKRRCVAIYSSQIDMKTVEEITRFGEQYGEAERFWVTPQAIGSWPLV